VGLADYKPFAAYQRVSIMPRRVVVCIEDEQDVTELIRIICQRHGFDFASANTGEAGLALVQSKLPDLVLLDLMMPGVDGWTVYDRLKADAATAAIPIIVVTARAYYDQRVAQMRTAEADNLVTKPFGPAQLTEAIDRVLRASAK
jgi:DNA-binding response OmpR family regulator